MLYKYELACREAGVEEEKVKELRRMFDREYKRMYRRKKAMRESGYIFLLASQINVKDTREKEFQFADPDSDTEKEAVWQANLKQLREELNELPADDREFLLAFFEAEHNAEQQMAEKYGMTRWQVRYRRKKLIEQLRKRMGVDLK